MNNTQMKTIRRTRRKRGIRKRVYGTPARPRLTVFRSNTQIYAQIVDDATGRTLVSASSLKLDKGSNVEAAKSVGASLAEAAKSAGVEKVAFDRSGYRFHGRVKALADAAREKGLSF